MFKGGKGAIMDLFDNDLKKRAILCAAIYGSIPGVALAIGQLISNWDGVSAALQSDFKKCTTI